MSKTESKARKIAGRPRSYTATALRTAVNKYFSSISREKELWEKIDTGKKDKNGRPIIERVRILNALGEPATEIEYFVKPSIAGLCSFLHIHRDTWNSYFHDDEYRDICAAASGEIEAYLCSQLGNGKGDSGIIFNLTHNYGWKNKIEIDAGENTKKIAANIPKTLEEKMKFLMEHGYNIPGAGEIYDTDDN